MRGVGIAVRLRRWLVNLVVLACAVGLLAAMGPKGSVVGSGPGPWHERFITDAQGRALILYGLNTSSSAKNSADGMPWITKPGVAQEYNTLGTDFVRYLIQWRQVEPSPGVFDQHYLAEVAQRVAWYQAKGYQVLLDMHQDVYGPAVDGNGAPAWATDSGGQPVKPQSPWELTYTQPGVVHAFDEFWGTRPDHPEYQQQYVAAWEQVAKYFAGNTAVIGYDLMNEPWGGSVQGPAFESGPLAAFYQRTIDGIRTVDSSHWLFVEPEAVSANWAMPSALPRLTDPRSGEARIGYAPHLYPQPIDSGSTYSGTSAFLTDRSIASWTIQVERTAQRLDAPVLLGEWGLDATEPSAHLYVDKVQSVLDQMMIGEAYWSSDPGPWSPWTKPGQPAPIASVLQTAYPRAIAGEPVSFSYDKPTLQLTVSWTDKPGVTGSTDVYLPPSDFPNGGQIDLNGVGSPLTHWNPKTHILSVTVPKQAGLVHTLVVTPAN
ncbi:cellulase family glycosylhydrolase [Streptacidiphilus sp. N1-12]|uniref:Cellulase family glycosylhydrolase n=2 Tax=Streptacidiphilus alkalitolerans TaxID=3342712 RepID=A0ABV6WM56_9ACTN